MRLWVSMPIHPHLGDLAVLGLAEDRSAGIHPFAGAAPAVGAAKLRREPRTRGVDLARFEGHLGLIRRDVLPIRLDRLETDAPGAERRLEKHGIGGEDGGDLIDGAAVPSAAKRIQQLAIGPGHGAQYTPNLEPPVATYGRRKRPRSLPLDPRLCFAPRTQED